MLYTAIDIHKSVFQAAALDTGSGEITDARFPATRDALQRPIPLTSRGFRRLKGTSERRELLTPRRTT